MSAGLHPRLRPSLVSVTVNFPCSGTQALCSSIGTPWGPSPVPAVLGNHPLPTSSALRGAQCDLSYSLR